MSTSLLRKYNKPVPRYTSYPTVPYWDNAPSAYQWQDMVADAFAQSNARKGIALYIHLPFCESLCTYCGCNTRITVNHHVEIPYIQDLLSEWALYNECFDAQPIIRELHLGGGTPTFFNPANLQRLIEGILKHSVLAEDAVLSFEAHPHNTTQAHLDTLYALGFRRISIGVQDFDTKVQCAINRIQTRDEVAALSQKARLTGFDSVNYDLIYGLPMQTETSVSQTIQQVLQDRPDRIAFYSYAHIPWRKPAQKSFESMLPKPEMKHQLYTLGKQLLLESGYVEIGMDHFALPSDELAIAANQKQLHRNFMGYTVRHTQLLIGLGVSSIGDAWMGFAQNAKTVDEYRQLLKQRRLPITHGHQLTNEDLVLRRHILRLMCRFETSWALPQDQTAVLYDLLPQLQALESDGLLHLEAQSLKITPLGRGFVRNICAVFDARLQQKAPQSAIFSQSI
nr:oxygen-independent coproporphyrinogen III oxidase [Eisenibacter elegans]